MEKKTSGTAWNSEGGGGKAEVGSGEGGKGEVG